MEEKQVVTRFAPSPTGNLNIGGVRAGIFAYLFARHNKGKFILRIEDTDLARSKKEYEDNILESLAWLGIEVDETYRQTDHRKRHEECLRLLVEKDLAYVSTEEPQEEGERAEVIRFRNPNKKISFYDDVHGSIEFDTTELKDFVIAKSFTEPVFHFALVVDDWDEGVTHVVRGEDHISNTPRQILIQEALGAPRPAYAHLPLILGPDRSKLSKRKGAKAITEYRSLGFIPEGVFNYDAFLGWHPDGEKEIYAKDELIKEFTLDRVQKNPAMFDEVKLAWFNHEHLKKLTTLEYELKLKVFLEEHGEKAPAYLFDIVPELQARAQTLGEAAELIRLGEFAFMEADISFDSLLLIQGAKVEAGVVKANLEKALGLLKDIPSEGFTAGKVKEAVFPYATEVGRAGVLWPMRVALSGKEKSPDPFTLAGLIGKEKTLKRIEVASQML